MKKFMAAWFADWQKKLKDHAVIIGLFIGILTLLTGGIGIWLSRIPPEIPPKIIAPILSPEAPGEPPLPTHIRKTPFFGRKEEIKTLFQFASGDKRKFSWWLVCGAGGTGKTRLAAEFASRLAKKSWNAGFIDLGRMPRVTWDTWKPDKPAFIIVDNASLYVAMDPPRPLDDSARPADLVRMMTMLSERADSFDYPVRLLLLERTWKQQEAKEDDAARQREISTAWFERLQKQNASCYQPDRPLELGPLEDEGLMNIARNKLGEKTPQDFIRQLSKIDPLKRTLFAEYLALYLQEHGPPMQRVLKQEDLLHFMGQREAKTTWRHATVERQEFLSIILATLTGKACQVGPEHYSDKADPKQYCFDRQKTLANHGIGFFDEHVFYLGPLKPDILGEFCVLSGGMGSQNPAWYLPTGSRLEADNPLKDLVLKAWAINPEGTFSFFFRCVSDFKENSNLPHLLSYIPEGAAQQLFWARAALHMGNAQNDRARYDDALGWYKKSLAIREKHLGPDHPDTGTSYNNIGSVYESQGEYEKALEWYG
ncbi:tetratricopeptide repeat protein, partial [Desulfosarcina sp. OttesenSCG-928-A07]|nr:tetratricopeptide repeat protein [Desulfosarcina sp. OttesenSCG-928-G17]MDL2330334.1 tetratricopeptide repeat protein [Desulfosarcina sp. OttesenSCG-928-A07]